MLRLRSQNGWWSTKQHTWSNNLFRDDVYPGKYIAGRKLLVLVLVLRLVLVLVLLFG